MRVARDSLSSRGIADVKTSLTGGSYRLLWAGTLGVLGLAIRVATFVAPQPAAAFPPWQGMHYVRDM